MVNQNKLILKLSRHILQHILRHQILRPYLLHVVILFFVMSFRLQPHDRVLVYFVGIAVADCVFLEHLFDEGVYIQILKTPTYKQIKLLPNTLLLLELLVLSGCGVSGVFLFELGVVLVGMNYARNIHGIVLF